MKDSDFTKDLMSVTVKTKTFGAPRPRQEISCSIKNEDLADSRDIVVVESRPSNGRSSNVEVVKMKTPRPRSSRRSLGTRSPSRSASGLKIDLETPCEASVSRSKTPRTSSEPRSISELGRPNIQKPNLKAIPTSPGKISGDKVEYVCTTKKKNIEGLGVVETEKCEIRKKQINWKKPHTSPLLIFLILIIIGVIVHIIFLFMLPENDRQGGAIEGSEFSSAIVWGVLLTAVGALVGGYLISYMVKKDKVSTFTAMVVSVLLALLITIITGIVMGEIMNVGFLWFPTQN